MMDDLKKYLIPALIGIAAFLLRELYAAFKANTTAIANLNLTMVELKSKVEMLTMQITPISKIKEDLNAVHTKIRMMQTKEPK